MLLTYLLLWVSLILISYMYLVIVHRNPPHVPPKRRCLWSFAFGNLGNLRRNYVNSSWNDYCFRVRNPYLCTERISEMKKSGTLSFKLNLPNLGLAQPVLELYMRERERLSTDSSLKPLLPWMILGLSLPLLFPLIILCLRLKCFAMISIS